MDASAFCDSLFEYKRIATCEVNVGGLTIGGTAPIRVQSMTTTNTNDTEASVEQSIKIIEAGGELVRLTTQGTREAANLTNIRDGLRARGYDTPLVADVHFNPAAAMTAAGIVEKVRINPGNFTGEAKRFNMSADKMSDDEWMNVIINKLTPLVEKCKANKTAIRIGVNHGSLSDRIMAKYGDTPQGMVASCMEYLKAFDKLDFHEIVISIKSSNTRVMVETVRLLTAAMKEAGTVYPLHLGVTEAGSDIEGRIKSAAGIGALLIDGIGNTVRVSLTEAPEAEIPVAKYLVDYVTSKSGHKAINTASTRKYSPYEYHKRETRAVGAVGGNNQPVVIVDANEAQKFVDARNIDNATDGSYIFMTQTDLTSETLAKLQRRKDIVIVAGTETSNPTAELRSMILTLSDNDIDAPVIVWLKYDTKDLEKFEIESAADSGLLFIDGLADGLMLTNSNIDKATIENIALEILQATRVRFSKAEFISCPGCGRTLYDIQSQTQKIKAEFSHLKGLKIAVMGCIVNGIGEMADADYGYVGAGVGKISLYRKKEMLKSNLPQESAINELISILKDDGVWTDKDKINN